MTSRPTRFGVRDENAVQPQQNQQEPVKPGEAAAPGAGPSRRNPLAEIRRAPLQQRQCQQQQQQQQKPKSNDKQNEQQGACEPQSMEVDEPVEAPVLVLPQPPVQVQAEPVHEDQLYLEAMYRQITDVDAAGPDSRDAQQVACYAEEIFAYLQSLEPAQAVRPDYLCQPAKMEITPRMHRILFDWLVQVHQGFGLLPETLYLTLHIVDYYMTQDGSDVTKTNYQLLGVSALFLAAKVEEIYPPSIDDLVNLTETTCSRSQIRGMERRLLAGMDFFFGYPQPILFLRRYSRVSGATAEVHDGAKFLAELGRCNYELAHLAPSLLAAAAFCLAAELLAESGRLATRPRAWLPELEVFSGYRRACLQEPALRLLARTVLQAYGERNKYTAVRKKYESRSFQRVSLFPEFTDPASPVLQAYANNIGGGPAAAAAAAGASQ